MHQLVLLLDAMLQNAKLENATLSGFLIILFVTNQSGTNFNVSRWESIALLLIFLFFFFIYQGNILAYKFPWKQLYCKFLKVMYRSVTESNSNGQVSRDLSHISWDV